MKNLLHLTTIFILLNIPVYSFACFNVFFGQDSKGHYHEVGEEQYQFNTGFNQKRIEQDLRNSLESLSGKDGEKHLSDYAFLMVKAGKIKEALSIYEVLAENFPNSYEILANLGTTYELSGNNRKALVYIEKALKINPDSHEGSEWIHVALLQVKITLEADSNYLDTHTILNLTKAQENDPQVLNQLYIQLQERFPFCPGPEDPVMADLLEDLGDCFLNSTSFEHAKAIYQVAKNYYGSKRTSLDTKIELALSLRKNLKNNEFTPENSRKSAMYIYNRITGIPYKKLLVTPKNVDYVISWKGISFNPDTLLQKSGISRSQQIPEYVSKKTDNLPKFRKSNRSLWLIIGTAGILLISLIVYLRTKSRSQRK